MTTARPATVTTVAPTSLDIRILDAAAECIARKGVSRTTLDDVARSAGCGRATIYRTFPGGKDAVMLAVGQHELTRFFERVRVAVAAGTSLESCLVAALSTAARDLAGHPALRYLLDNEPEIVLPLVAFQGFDPLLAWASAFARAQLAPYVDGDEAAHIGEWAARMIVSHGLDESSAVDLGDPDVAAWFVRTFLLPGLQSDRCRTDAPDRPERSRGGAPTASPDPIALEAATISAPTAPFSQE